MFDVDLELLINDGALEFYADNKDVSLDKLLFRYAKDSLSTARSIQLESRRRAVKKLPDWSSIPAIVFPPKSYLEQASSQETAQYKSKLIPYQTSVDLTGGTGIDSWQMAFHSQKHTYVETNLDLCKLARHNFRELELEHIQIISRKAEEYLHEMDPVDLIYLDPLRRKDGRRKVLLEDYSPNVIALKERLLAKSKNVLIKVSALADLTYLINLFHPHLQTIHVVAVKNECKELLVHLSSEENTETVIKTVNLENDTSQGFSFRLSDESARASIAESLSTYLYEPNAAVLKAGAFHSTATRFNLLKLHINSHLYTSNVLVRNFPGNVYQIVEVSAPFKFTGKYVGVSIATRNYPESVATIRKKTRLQEGDQYKLFATTLANRKAFIVCKKITD